jgi:hypothetical protein
MKYSSLSSVAMILDRLGFLGFAKEYFLAGSRTAGVIRPNLQAEF